MITTIDLGIIKKSLTFFEKCLYFFGFAYVLDNKIVNSIDKTTTKLIFNHDTKYLLFNVFNIFKFIKLLKIVRNTNKNKNLLDRLTFFKLQIHIDTHDFEITTDMIYIIMYDPIIEMPKEICNIATLENLTIEGFLFTKIPKNISNLVNLKVINISNYFINISNYFINNFLKIPHKIYIPNEFYNLLQLEELILINVSHNINSKIRNLINLKKIVINYDNLTLPKQIFNLINLQYLDFSCNKLSFLPKKIYKLINLQYLNISNIKIKKIPKKICKLINLQYLDISHTKIKKIPKQICNLINLQYLNIDHNKLTFLPKQICNLINLQYLNIENNKLKFLPKQICNLINLQSLIISYNKFKILPKKICKLINLNILYADHNKLKILPKKISNLINLNVLKLSHNLLPKIPIQLCNLINLQSLTLDNNKIRIIPPEISNLVNLYYLSVCGNKITKLPLEITNLRFLETFIYQYGNPIEYISPQVIRYLRMRQYINKNKNNIYYNNQNVHDHVIQNGITKSINYIMSIKPIYDITNLQKIINNNTLIDTKTKNILQDYIKINEVHSILKITFAELLLNVISYIEQHKFKNEIYNILEQDIKDSIDKCFTGRLSRLINCLNGFDDNIVINISDSEQIANIIIIVKEKLEKENNYSIDEYKNIVMKELSDRGYTKDIITEWLDNI